jgi:hypothetical protein
VVVPEETRICGFRGSVGVSESSISSHVQVFAQYAQLFDFIKTLRSFSSGWLGQLMSHSVEQKPVHC